MTPVLWSKGLKFYTRRKITFFFLGNLQKKSKYFPKHEITTKKSKYFPKNEITKKNQNIFQKMKLQKKSKYFPKNEITKKI